MDLVLVVLGVASCSLKSASMESHILPVHHHLVLRHGILDERNAPGLGGMLAQKTHVALQITSPWGFNTHQPRQQPSSRDGFGTRPWHAGGGFALGTQGARDGFIVARERTLDAQDSVHVQELALKASERVRVEQSLCMPCCA